MIGQTLGHYRIIEKIGAGGMGEVYRAYDERLERDVALKILPAGALIDEHARKRFRKEALALSKLNHPNVETVHDFDSHDGVDFLVMEYIPGVTLSERLERGPLTEKEIAQLGLQMAEGLAAAHKEGIVHRDVKPGNLRVTPEGRLEILDFGIAKLFEPVSGTATTVSFTETQAVAGTLPYMAPEQLRGQSVDARSDIYAAGVVLFEMATGRRPFEEKLVSALTDAIIHQPPPPPGRLRHDLSARLEEAILKCLEKEPDNRYQSAKELAVDLRRLGAPAVEVPPRREPRGSGWWAVRLGGAALGAAVLAVLVGLNVGRLREKLFGAATPKIDSLAVLPLKNLMGGPGQDYFVEGMHEALITELSKISALKVISRTSTLRYKDTEKSLPQVARELNVDGVIEGSVRREGDEVRITVQLIHGPSDGHLWAQSFDRELRGVLNLQSEVARAIAHEIKVTLTPGERARLASARPVNPEAHEAYLKGRYYWNKRNPEGLKKGLEYFKEAIEIDPVYALAYVALADSYDMLGLYGVLAPTEAFPPAKAALAKALELDDTLGEAHASLAGLYWDDWDWRAAEGEYRRALELNSNYSSAHHWYAIYLAALGRHQEAIREIRRARELDPLSPIIRAVEVMILFFGRKYDEVIRESQDALDMDPNFGWIYVWRGSAYLEQGVFVSAVADFERHAAASATSDATARLGYAYGRVGRRADALKIVRELEQLSKRVYVSSFDIALVYVGLGDKTGSFAWLEKAYENKEGIMWLQGLGVNPWFDGVRDDPRFQDLLRRMNFPE